MAILTSSVNLNSDIRINEYFINIADSLAKKINPLYDLDFVVKQEACPPVLEFNEITSDDTAVLIRD